MNSIGKVNFVSYDKLGFEISDFDKLEFNQNGEFYITKGILDFVTIVSRQNIKFIYKIEKLEDEEKPLSKEENAKFKHTANVICSPIGIIEDSKINFNLTFYPFLQDDVFLTTIEDMNIIFSVDSSDNINLGLIDNTFPAMFNINKLLTIHSAILGNTGSGKSTTVRQMLKQVLKFTTKNLSLHVFDVHQEYRVKNEKIKHIDVLKEYTIPLRRLELQDWVNLVKPSDLVQLPILRMALQLARAISDEKVNETCLKCYLALTMYRNVQSDAVAKRAKIIGLLQGTGVDTSQYNAQYANFNNQAESNFIAELEEKIKGEDFSNLPTQLENSSYQADNFEMLLKSLNYIYYQEEAMGNSGARNYSQTLETRIKEVSIRYADLFNCSKVDEIAEEATTPITVYDVSELDDDLLLFFTSYLCKEHLNINRKKNLQDRRVNVFLFEEAHRYISRSKEHSQFYEIEIFRKIAREGRKFGCFLYLSSQRPSELSSTVLSQCNNYLLHRIKNNIDLEYLSKTIPYIDSNQLKRLSYLPTGVTYAIGELFPIPIEIKITEPIGDEDVTQTPKIKFD